jgi:multiple sugar transport system substrate-binding protein
MSQAMLPWRLRLPMRQTRRRFLQAAGATLLGAPSVLGRARHASAQTKPGKLVYGNIGPAAGDDAVFQEGVDLFTKASGIPVDVQLGGDAELFQKILAWVAANQPIDAVFVRENFLAAFVKDGILQPVDGMPGLDQLKPQITPLFLQSMERNGKTWGLPYYAEVETCWLFEDKLKKAGIADPPKSWEELTDVCLKAKRDGVATYPMVWAAGQGDHHLPWQWFTQVHARGGKVFDDRMKPLLGDGSVAREALSWWRKTFIDWKITDPRSVELRYIPAMKAFGTGEYLFALVLFQSWLQGAQDPANSAVAGRVRLFQMPGNGKSIAYARLHGMTASAVSRDWTWTLMNYLGGKTPSGEFVVPTSWSVKRGYVPAYKALWNDPALKTQWSKWTDFDALKTQIENAAHSSVVVPATYEAWYPQWLDFVNVNLQNCITGKIAAEQACDEMAAKAEQLAKS